MIEVTEEAGVAPYPHVPPGVMIESNHIHFFVDEASPLKAQAWYVEMFRSDDRGYRGGRGCPLSACAARRHDREQSHPFLCGRSIAAQSPGLVRGNVQIG